MKNLLLLALSCVVSFAGAAPGAGSGCLPVTGDRILASDLARADARFSALPASQAVGATPAPGTSRVFTTSELSRIARGSGIALDDPVEVCFELPLRMLDAAEILTELRKSLPGATIRITELPRNALPV